MRRVLLFIHRWLGLTAGVIFAIASLTGGVLVYQDELDALMAGPRFQTTAGLIDPDAIDAAIRRAAPDRRLLRVIWPTTGANVLNVRVIDGTRQRDLVLDAGSGAPLRPRPLHILLQATRRLHASLLIGQIGNHLVLYASAASVVSLILGLFLWWPSLRRFAQGFRIRWHRGLYVLNFDLHQMLGVIALPLLLVMTVSGVLFHAGVMDVVARMLHGSRSVDKWTALKSAASDPNALDIGLSAAVRLARAGDEHAALTRVDFPTMPDGVVIVWMTGRSTLTDAHTIRVALDRHTGAILGRQRLRYDAATNARLHFGSIGGAGVRALYATSCFIGFALLPTGMTMWWLKRRTRV